MRHLTVDSFSNEMQFDAEFSERKDNDVLIILVQKVMSKHKCE